jgi:cell division transport system permease protein
LTIPNIAMWISFKRVFRSGFVNFWRNGFVSLSSVLVMVITLMVIGSLVFVSALLQTSLDQLRNKVDINVYFVTSATEADVLSVQKSLQALPEVKDVSYTSREQALEDFKKRHTNDQLVLQALDELGDNPLAASLNIRAKDPSQYEGIATFLKSESVLSQSGKVIVGKVNYYDNQSAIKKLAKIIKVTETGGLALTILLVVISVIITLNTIRLAIYVSREEISVMRLVGASYMYVRGPFVITGIMYGVIAGIITLAVFYPVTYYIHREAGNFFAGIDLFNYYILHFGNIFLIVMGSGVVIGAISSFLAVRRYLKI